MFQRFEDFEHLIRMAGLFAVGTLGLLLLRGALVPSDFGTYGHFRAGSLDDNRAQELVYAGRELCGTCHEDVVETRRDGSHAEIGCEACHGPLATHAEDPTVEPAALPGVVPLCQGCHALSASKPAWFAQVDEEEHALDEPCNSCHDPHHPDLE